MKQVRQTNYQFEEIKSNYRICEIGEHFYIQEKTVFGWSYDTGCNWIKYPSWPAFLGIFTLILTCVSIILFVIALFSIKAVPTLVIFTISTFICWTLFIILTKESKSLAVVEHSYLSANITLDKIVQTKLNEIELSKQYEEKRLKEKSVKKEKKYHYFYTEKQMRAEKLKKLKKI